ncbi:Transcription factor atf21 [Fusarium oxysporum f. sp. cubense]|uniref:Transcription factor atf21 n=1 Tax=Fusarium oxysporum f. sp. cubense TaxID=61366 RepID=A0A559KRR6_FUSOC|nr:Transcription factor atf21 [Fusarium oxysporum f. sp. cubense]
MPADAESNRWQLLFEKAIDTCSVTVGAGLGPSYIILPTQPTEFGNLEGNEALQNIRPTVIDDKKLDLRPYNRRQLQADRVLSEPSVSEHAVELPKPRKRGRKSKKQPKNQKVARQQDGLGDDGLPKHPRRRRILERNRIAATKCRIRKRDEASALASREEALKDQNRYLTVCFDTLTDEIYHLKTQLLRHTNCNCVLIQNYIANEAQKCVGRLVACSTAIDIYGSSLSPGDGSPGDASTAKELVTQSLNGGGFPSTPRTSFQKGSSASKVTDVMSYMMGLGPFQTATMSPDSMVFAQSVAPLSFTRYEPGLSVHEGP